MNIFLSFLQSPFKYSIPSYSFWEYYIKNGIEESGDNWFELEGADWAYGLVPKPPEAHARWKTEIWSQTIRHLQKKRVDLFLSYLYPSQIDENAIREIQNMGIPCVNFFCDNVRQFTKPPKEFEIFDLNWVPEYKALKNYKKAGIKYMHLPMPMWVEPQLRTTPNDELPQVSFIGSKDIQRQLLLEAVMTKAPNVDMSIYGTAWHDNEGTDSIFERRGFKEKLFNQVSFIRNNGLAAWRRKLKQRQESFPISSRLKAAIKGVLSSEDYVKITKDSCVTLGISRYPSFRFPLNSPDSYSRLRDIEAPMLGACYLTEWTEGLDQMYDVGDEIETYRSDIELIEKIDKLTKDRPLRKKLRKSGQQKALALHSIPNTLSLIKNHFNLKPNK